MTYPNPIREALANAAERLPAEQPNPAGQEIAERLDARIGEIRDAVKGVDPLIDRSLVDLERRSAELDATAREVRRVKHQAATGIIPPRVAETVLAEQESKIRQDVKGAIAAAEEAFRVGRERLLAEVLPPVDRGDPAAQVVRDELRAVMDRFEDPAKAIEAAFQEVLAEGDDLALRLLLGTWGRKEYLRRQGASEEVWQGMVESFHQALAKRAQAADPRSRQAKAWRTIVGRDLPQFLAAAGGRLMFQVDRLR